MSLIYRTTDSRSADACYIGSQKTDDKGGDENLFFSGDIINNLPSKWMKPPYKVWYAEKNYNIL